MSSLGATTSRRFDLGFVEQLLVDQPEITAVVAAGPTTSEEHPGASHWASTRTMFRRW
jgi:tartrate dehydratase beta subunit/fumarate hydratase class I family protein